MVTLPQTPIVAQSRRTTGAEETRRRTPETGRFGSYGNPNIITYNAHEHPDLRSDGTLLVTYNVNSLDWRELYDDATIYRPRFIRLQLTPAEVLSTP